VATKRELSSTAKLSVLKSIFFVPILIYGHKSWAMTEGILTQVQVLKMGFLRRVYSVTKGCTEVRLRPGQETSLAPPYLNLRCFGSTVNVLRRRKNLRHCCDFSAAPSDSASGSLCLPRCAPGVALRDKVRNCKIRRALNVEPLLLIERTQLR